MKVGAWWMKKAISTNVFESLRIIDDNRLKVVHNGLTGIIKPDGFTAQRWTILTDLKASIYRYAKEIIVLFD